MDSHSHHMQMTHVSSASKMRNLNLLATKWKCYFVFCCFLLRAELVNSKNCVKKDKCSCTFDDDSGTMDLSKLGKPSPGDPLIHDAMATSADMWQYSFNPCYPFTEGTCSNAAGCQYDSTMYMYYNIGDADKVDFSMDGNDVVGTYTSDDGLRSSKVTYVCDSNVDPPKTEVKGEDPPSSTIYVFKITSKLLCSESISPTDGPSVSINVETSISAGWVLIIIVLCLLFVYVVSGVLINKFVRKAEGREIVPNVTFWSGLPGHIKDGCGFTCAKIRRTEYQPI